MEINNLLKNTRILHLPSPAYRHEMKYQIDQRQKSVLQIRAASVMQLDSHAAEKGYYRISSLYFDTAADRCLLENLSGSDPRTKYRIRIYNDDLRFISFEKKSKLRGMCRKESCRITEEECRWLMEGKLPPTHAGTPPMKKYLFADWNARALLPKVIVSYDRIPYIYTGGNVRVTFDFNISSASDISGFLSGEAAVCHRPVMPPGQGILEVKWDEVMPRHITDTLASDRLTQTACSKYTLCRIYHL